MVSESLENLRNWAAEFSGYYWDTSENAWIRYYGQGVERWSADEWRPDERMDQAWLVVAEMQPSRPDWLLFIDQQDFGWYDVGWGHSYYDAQIAPHLSLDQVPWGVIATARAVYLLAKQAASEVE